MNRTEFADRVADLADQDQRAVLCELMWRSQRRYERLAAAHRVTGSVLQGPESVAKLAAIEQFHGALCDAVRAFDNVQEAAARASAQ